ncbi:SH3 and PX-domain-containing 3 [Favolaschia claudopus]|uniref:SH3 and PX-domain-containing 3 n=1 Tax=Favolaschia claudopus TaxID=2862362 RepID=A0AAW0CLY3_9AGAR
MPTVSFPQLSQKWNRPRFQSQVIRIGLCVALVLGGIWFLLPRWRVGYSEAIQRGDIHILEDPLADGLGHPSFREVKLYEGSLPQHHSSGKWSVRPRYLFFPWASWGSGWNNIFQEQLMNTHLAYLSQRAYVFPQYIPRDHPPFPDTLENGTRHMLHIPMNAFVSGPTSGGPLSADSSDSLAGRAVPEEWWNIACPREQVVVVDLHQTMSELGIDSSKDDGGKILERWAAKLSEISAPCVSIEGGSVFDYILFGYRILSAWPSYGNSPTLKYFTWSPLVTAALFRNFHVLSSSPPPEYLLPKDTAPYRFTSFNPLRASEPPISGLLGIHVRRGDYEYHCPFLADIGAEYNAWSSFGTPGISQRPEFENFSRPAWPALLDYLDVPENISGRDARFNHCLPTAEAVVARVGRVREEAKAAGIASDLRRIYVATNAEQGWIENLTTLLKAEGWEVSTSFEMDLTLEERAVGQAVDMGILTAAEVFIGVGVSVTFLDDISVLNVVWMRQFSSLTSNVVQIRLAGGKDPRTIRFW